MVFDDHFFSSLSARVALIHWESHHSSTNWIRYTQRNSNTCFSNLVSKLQLFKTLSLIKNNRCSRQYIFASSALRASLVPLFRWIYFWYCKVKRPSRCPTPRSCLRIWLLATCLASENSNGWKNAKTSLVDLIPTLSLRSGLGMVEVNFGSKWMTARKCQNAFYL